ncbi:MAG: sodium:proton antiporter [Bernardetiaceae bacterium]|nr:sodium:proton antiporter [Bernardetiaceae bacterium]
MRIKRIIILTLTILFTTLLSASPALAGALGGGEVAASPWSVVPFAILLIVIAVGPIFIEDIWHRHYPKVALILAAIVVIYYLAFLGNTHGPVHALAEYVQFIALIGSLYIASGGILIRIDKKSKPLVNIVILVIGAIISNFIGTTGASMLLIRPFIRLNEERLRPYHVVFFIFIVSNIGGSLTPIGDPPLFLGFLKGVPFGWTLVHNFVPWLVGIIVLCITFYIVDKRNNKPNEDFFGEIERNYTNKIEIIGKKNFIWLGLIIAAVFLDPNVFDWVPGITYHGDTFSFIREILMFTIAFLSWKWASKEAHEGNEFTIEPIREVGFIFIGIFGTMMPALELVSEFAKSDAGASLISATSLYWGTGLLSGFLDNAPTYLNFLAAALASQGGSISSTADVVAFAAGDGFDNSVLQLKAISVAAVFFGAMTYIGNGPNFMVKSIAEQSGLRMPSFFGYIFKYSIPYLFILLGFTWAIFFGLELL